jgi:glycosyltransferase involved in cell wall biosynthesis
MNKKTIWVVNQFAGTPESGWGERHYYLSKYWIKKGYKVFIISGSYNHLFITQPNVKNTFTIEELEPNLYFCWIKITKYKGESIYKFINMLIFTFKFSFFTEKKIDNPDVIIVSSMPIFTIFPAYFKARKVGAKLIFEIRDLWPETPIHLKNMSKNNPFIVLLKIIERFAYKKSKYIVSLLPNSFHYINKISKKPSKFCYIPNGIDEKLLSYESLPKVIIDKIPKNKFIVGYTGTIGLANAMEHFINAAITMQENKNIHFVLVGDGYKKQEFIQIAKGLNNITFVEKIKKSQVQHILSFFDVCYVGRYASPLYKHGVSYNKYFDYMLAKKTILESSELIKDPVELSGCGIIVKPESAQAIKEGILYLYNLSEEERKEMGQKGYEYVTKFHNFDYLSDKYIKLFNND